MVHSCVNCQKWISRIRLHVSQTNLTRDYMIQAVEKRYGTLKVLMGCGRICSAIRLYSPDGQDPFRLYLR